MGSALRTYLTVTGGYWAFTVTDGAIRMLVVLYFHQLGYSPFEVAMLFLFYEFFGVVTNLVGGWLGARIGLNLTMHIGMGMQIVALVALTVPDVWLSVPYVMAAQALSGIAKDLNKMSAKVSVKIMVKDGGESKLFRWVAMLTGSKNALKGAGFFFGAALLEGIGFRGALLVLAGMLLVVLIATAILLPSGVGKMKSKPKFTQVFSRVAAINWLSAARFFLFASRDVWFVVGLPVFLYEVLGWSFTQVGVFMASWVIGYGIVQASAPKLIRHSHHGQGPSGGTARLSAFVLAVFPASIAIALQLGWPPEQVLIVGLILFGVIFAINSAVHSYLILAYSDHDKVAMTVGFVEAGIPLGVTFSFLIASPMINEVAAVILVGILGWKLAALYVIAGLLVAWFGGIIMQWFRPERWVEEYVWKIRMGEMALPQPDNSYSGRHRYALAEVKEIVGRIWQWVLLGIAVGALFHGFVPETWVSEHLKGGTWYDVPMAVLLGIPLYSNATGIIPVAEAMLSKGVAIGTTLALMMSVAALSLPEMLILRKVIQWQALALFATVLATAFILVGWIFNLAA